MKSRLVVLLLLLAVGGRPSVSRAANDPCENLNLPEKVSILLEKYYPRWRVEKISDLHREYQEVWTKNYPAACPGFVAGHFQKPDSIAYAFLLVPADQTKKGYRLVVFSETIKDSWHPIVLEKDDQYTPTSAFIRLAPPGHYGEADRNRNVDIRTDGIFSERFEAGALVYYWNGIRFRSIAVSV